MHLQASDGTLVIVPAPDGVLVVTVGDVRMNVGLVRLEMLRAAESLV
jgi:predicted regulator of Ras-like GTPase activity (Roadblock/LC7/MglB family)